MKPVVFHPEADSELVSAAQWYDRQKLGLGADLLDEVDAAISRIAAAPEAFGILTRNIRLHRLHRFPFGIVYREEPDRIIVIAVMHLHRAPDYWKHRA
jgi:plasmid stabilization system protein ParE